MVFTKCIFFYVIGTIIQDTLRGEMSMRKLKKIVTLAIASIMMMSMFSACGSNDSKETTKGNESSAQVADVKVINNGVLTVGAEIGYPPFESFAEDGTTPVGFDIDIIAEVSRRIGMDYNFINTSFDGIFAGIGVNYDCVCSAVTVTAERKNEMLFSVPYIQNYQAIVVRADSELEISSFTDLNNMTVAFQKGTTSDELMKDLKSTGTVDIETVANDKLLSCFTQLTNKEVDVVAVDNTVATSFVSKNSDKYKIAFVDDSEPEEFAIAFGKNDTQLQAAVNKVLEEMKEDGFIQETYDYWFGVEAE